MRYKWNVLGAFIGVALHLMGYVGRELNDAIFKLGGSEGVGAWEVMGEELLGILKGQTNEVELYKTNSLTNRTTISSIPVRQTATDNSAEGKIAVKTYHIQLDENPKVDNTKRLQDQLDALPADEELVVKLPKGRFWTEGATNETRGSTAVTLIKNKKNWTIIGIGTTFYTKSPAMPFEKGDLHKGVYSPRRHLVFLDCENVTVKGLRIEGSNYTLGTEIGRTPETTPAFWTSGERNGGVPGYPMYVSFWEFEHAFDIRSSRNITFDGCEADSIWGDGFYISTSRTWYNGRYHTGTISENIQILNSKVRFCGRMAVATPEVKNLLIDNLVVDHARWSSLDLEPDHQDQVIDGVEIRNSTLKNQLITFAMGGAGEIKNVNVHHNSYEGGGSLYLRPSASRPKVIRKNFKFNYNTRTARGGGDSFKVVWVNNFEAIGNVDRYNGKHFGKFTFCQNVVLRDNIIVEGGSGIHTAWVENLEYSNNSPALVHTDDSEITKQWAIDHWEKIKRTD